MIHPPQDPKQPVPAPVLADPYPGWKNRAMYLAYDLLWLFTALVLAPWWIFHCLLRPSFRRMVAERLTLGLPRLPAPRPGRPRVLIHGVSVGEVMASRALVERLKHTCEVVVSASTNTGMEVARRSFPDITIVRYPLDPRLVIRRFLRRVGPQYVILMELEVWPNFLKWSNREGIPIGIVNGRITEHSLRNYLRFHESLPQFARVTLFAAQDEAYAERFVTLLGGDERVVITGNLKADGMRVGPPEPDAGWRELEGWVAAAPGQPVLLAGSTHGGEEAQVYRAFHQALPAARIVIVPRHPERGEEVRQALEGLGVRAQRLTTLRQGAETLDPTRPLIADTVGELDRLYSMATIVFVGGSLVPHGGQNMLEPAAAGKPVLYGPHTGNFRQETALLEEAGAARRVADAEELARVLATWHQDPAGWARMGQVGMGVVEKSRGATERTTAALQRRLGLPLVVENAS
ncbi:MAG: 3-deoxy-D-manno-octulosonic acid transferase [Planctomycetota bacterium]